MVTVTLDPEIERRLEDLGAKDDRSKAALARSALVAALDEELDARRWALLADERKAVESTERIWTLEELERGDDLAS